MDNNKIIAITCNCGGAKNTVEAKLQVICNYHHKDNDYTGQAPLTPWFDYYRIRDVMTKPELAHIKEMAERAGAWEYLRRPGAGSDKIVVLPELNTWFDARQDYNVLKQLKPKEMEYVYSLGIKP